MSTAEILAELPRLSEADRAAIQARLSELSNKVAAEASLATHPAIGIWRDRSDLPQESSDASRLLRGRMMQPKATE